MKADRVRYDHRTGDVLATGTVDAQIGGRRVRAEKLRYRANTHSLELANLVLEGLADGADEGPAEVYHRARGNGMGGVPSSLPPSTPASSRLGVPWLHAASALAEEDLSHISGRDGVKIGAGAIAIEGRAFELDPVASRLEVEDAILRLRSPRTKIRAAILRAALSARDTTPGTPGRPLPRETARVRLEGDVEAQVELPFRLESGKTARVTVTAERLDARPTAKGSVGFVLAGSPVRLSVEGAELALEAPIVSGKIKRRRLLLEGQLAGRLVVHASAFPERKAARRPWVILSASALDLAPATARPAVWFGNEAFDHRPRRLIVRDALLEGDKEPRAELVLYRPTWA